MAEEEAKRYSVMELAELVGVPRTTINDWLTKYALYIESVMQGKRRIYTESALTVLKKVAELRNSGRSSFEIEKELAASCTVHPSPESPAPAQAPDEPKENKNTAEPDTVPDAVSSENALIARQNAEQLLAQFQAMMAKIDHLEEAAEKASHQLPPPAVEIKSNRGATIAFTLIVILLGAMMAAGGWFARKQFAAMQKESNELRQVLAAEQKQSDELAKNLAAEQKNNGILRENVSMLDQQCRAGETVVENLKKDLDQERTLGREREVRSAQEFGKALQELREQMKKNEENAAARADQQQKSFAQERLELLKQLQQMNEEARLARKQAAEKTAAQKPEVKPTPVPVKQETKAAAPVPVKPETKVVAPVPIKQETKAVAPAPVKPEAKAAIGQ